MSAPAPASPDAAAALSVYVHVPFCLHRCAYCDFATRAVAQVPRRAYLQDVLAELALRKGEVSARPIASVFFGGGTPSLWGHDAIGRVLQALDAWGGLAHDAEITVECNPGATESGDLRALTDAGVNRLSIGVQSLRDVRLKALDRIHDAAGARRTLATVADLLHAGRLVSASADLMYGLAGDDLDAMRADVQDLLAYDLPHLSAYALTVEPDTALAEQVARGRAGAPDDGLQADMLLALPGLLAPFGLQRYEVSNFARPGHGCRHNLAIWHGGAYLALGAGAHGFLPSGRPTAVGRRYGNLADERRWREQVRLGRLPEAFSEWIDAEMHLDERVLTGLRLTEGLDLSELHAFAEPGAVARVLRNAEKLQRQGLGVRVQGAHVQVTEAGLVALDRLILELLT